MNQPASTAPVCRVQKIVVYFLYIGTKRRTTASNDDDNDDNDNNDNDTVIISPNERCSNY